MVTTRPGQSRNGGWRPAEPGPAILPSSPPGPWPQCTAPAARLRRPRYRSRHRQKLNINAAIDVADEAGNNCIEIDEKLIDGACGCCMRGVGDISRRAPRLQFVVTRDHRLQFAGIETVENRDRGVFQLGIRRQVRISFDHLIGQPGIGIERTEHRRERLLRRKNQRGAQSSEHAVYGLLDFPHILMQQHLLALQVLQPAARSPYVKGWTPCRFFRVPGLLRYLQPHRRQIGGGGDQACRFLPQTPARGYRAAPSWRGAEAPDAAGPPPRPAVLARREGGTSASSRR